MLTTTGHAHHDGLALFLESEKRRADLFGRHRVAAGAVDAKHHGPDVFVLLHEGDALDEFVGHETSHAGVVHHLAFRIEHRDARSGTFGAVRRVEEVVEVRERNLPALFGVGLPKRGPEGRLVARFVHKPVAALMPRLAFGHGFECVLRLTVGLPGVVLPAPSRLPGVEHRRPGVRQVGALRREVFLRRSGALENFRSALEVSRLVHFGLDAEVLQKASPIEGFARESLQIDAPHRVQPQTVGVRRHGVLRLREVPPVAPDVLARFPAVLVERLADDARGSAADSLEVVDPQKNARDALVLLRVPHGVRHVAEQRHGIGFADHPRKPARDRTGVGNPSRERKFEKRPRLGRRHRNGPQKVDGEQKAREHREHDADLGDTPDEASEAAQQPRDHLPLLSSPVLVRSCSWAIIRST